MPVRDSGTANDRCFAGGFQSSATPGRVQLDVAGSHWHEPAISESQRPGHRNVAGRLISI